MRRDFDMILTILAFSGLCSLAYGSIEHGQGFPVFAAPQIPGPPVVTATSSQYFQRNFNRLVAAPPVLQPVVPVEAHHAVFVQPTPNAVPVAPTNEPVQPNVAIAVATANVAAPVATILLPPYPFGLPPNIGFLAPSPTTNNPDDRKEATTQTSTKVEVKTTTGQPEATTPIPAGSDNNIVQALPSNQNINFNQVYGPPPRQLPPQQRPQKFKTSVEIVPVPLTYIAPPPLKLQAIKTVKHVHTFLPVKAKVIIRPVHKLYTPLKVRKIRRPVNLVYKGQFMDRIGAPLNVRGPVPREIEPTTFRPSVRSATKPPRV